MTEEYVAEAIKGIDMKGIPSKFATDVLNGYCMSHFKTDDPGEVSEILRRSPYRDMTTGSTYHSASELVRDQAEHMACVMYEEVPITAPARNTHKYVPKRNKEEDTLERVLARIYG